MHSQDPDFVSGPSRGVSRKKRKYCSENIRQKYKRNTQKDTMKKAKLEHGV